MEYSANVMLDPVGLLLLPQYPQDIPSKLLRRMLRSSIWQKYQRGHLGLEAAAHLLAELPFVSRKWTALEIARILQSRVLKPASWMMQLLHVLRHQLHLRLFCVCNASPQELVALQAQFSALFAKFDATFTSGEEGFIRPSLRFFKIALNKARVHAHDTFYLDSHGSFESITAARSLGMHTLLLQPSEMDKLNIVSSSDMLITDILQVRFSSTPTSDLENFLMHSPFRQDVRNDASNASACNLKELKIKEVGPHISNGTMITCVLQAMPLPLGTAPECRSSARALAWKYLLGTGALDPKKSFQHPTLTSDGVQIVDNFTQFIIADVLNDHRFLPMQHPPHDHGLLCFMDISAYLHERDTSRSANTKLNGSYYASDMCTLEDIPEDLDATSIGLSVLHKFGKVDLKIINRALDTMLQYRSEDDGLFLAYFDAERPRIDPVVVANVVYLFHLANRGHEVEINERFLESVLLHKAYEGGTYYYMMPETFLWCVARLVHTFKQHFDKWRKLLADRLQGGDKSTSVLARAVRMHACMLCELDDDDDPRSREELVRMQRADGSWHCQPFYRYGSNVESWFTNEGLSTAFVLVVLAD